MVLSTDMALHFDLMGLVKHNLVIPSADLTSDRPKFLLLQLILHVSDISNPARPFRIASRWAELVIMEFLQQVSCAESLLIPLMLTRICIGFSLEIQWIALEVEDPEVLLYGSAAW